MDPRLADERTLQTLDFASVRERVVAQTRTQRGGAYARAIVPIADTRWVQTAQAQTAAARSLVEGTDFAVGAALETAAWTAAAERGQALSAADLRAVAEALAAASAAHARAREAPGDALAPVLAPYRPLRELARAITDAIDERGALNERASPALSRIRRNLAQAQAEARDAVAALLRSSKYAKAIQDSVVTIREERFVVPVKAEFSGMVPGIVHDTSSSGQTLFVEPLAALEANNRVRTLRIEERREIERILTELSRSVGEHAAQVEANVEMLAALDVLVAKADLARAMDAIAPELPPEPLLRVVHGRHPLLGARAVPQSLTLDDRTLLLVVSGPNMGGKTVTLKMAGLFVAMTYAGMQIPAAPGTAVGGFTHVVSDIGDEQSIAENTSTFSAHLQRMREILALAGERSLILVDEIGGGTEPASGAALATAMLEALLAVRARGVVTTHATELKLFAAGTPGVANASVRFDAQSFAPTYQLDSGMPGQSLAFALAASLAIPPQIVERAQALLSTRERDYEAALAELAQVGARLQSEREALQAQLVQTDSLERRLREGEAALQREREDLARHAEERIASALREFVISLRDARARQGAVRVAKVTPGMSTLFSRTLEAMRRDLGITPPERHEQTAGDFAEGDKVRVLSYGQEGTVVADNGESVLVAIGAMKTNVSRGDLAPVAQAREARPRGRAETAGETRMNAAMRTSSELDVRGKRYVEAEPLVEQWVDEAILSGNSPLRLIHGKGTGMLGRGLQEFLRAHRAVKNVRYGAENEGGGGVTVFELR